MKERTPVLEVRTGSRLRIVPMNIGEAKAYVTQHHRHHRAPVGALFAVAAAEGETVRGVAIVGRPVSRHLDDGWTVEVIRLATDGAHNACSMLYAASWRATRALGYTRCITYTLPEEGGASLRGAGWRCLGEAGGGSWNSPTRPRVDKHPTQMKIKWEAT